LQSKLAESKELADNRVNELRATMLECQKDLTGQRDLNNLFKTQIAQLEQEKSMQLNNILGKDALIDKLKEEIIVQNKVLTNRGLSKDPATDRRDYEEKSSLEFKRLLALAEQLKDAQIEAERNKMESLAKDKEYLRIKDQLANALETKNQVLRQADLIKYENGKLKEEQLKFAEELAEIRNIYESQIENLASKLHSSAEETIKQKTKTAELHSQNNILKYKIETSQKRLAEKEVEVEKLTNQKLFEMTGMTSKPKVTPTSLLVRGEMGESQLENSPDFRDDLGKSIGRFKTELKNEERSFKDPFADEKTRLDWDSLMFRINAVGTKH
jgi:hypothetical protein